MTVAPWARGASGGGGGGGLAQPPPVRISSAPDVSAPQTSLRGSDAAARAITGAADACVFVRCLISTPECGELIEAGGVQATTLRLVVAVRTQPFSFCSSRIP